MYNETCFFVPFVICPVRFISLRLLCNSIVSSRFFSSNPSAKLLRATHAPQVIYFLYRHFKESCNLSTPHSELVQVLNRYLEELHETEPDILRERAEAYLTQWSTGETRWLRRYFDTQHAESVYQLTPHTEDVLKFLTDILERTLGFVGTESRLTRILETLSDIVVRGSADADRRLEHLRAERARIDQEIQSIKAGDTVSTHSPTAIRERFADVVSDLISLQGDFRAVEESFKAITRDVQKQQTEATDTRGVILGSALEAERRLKEDDQGASFQAFVRLILSQTRQDELEKIIAQLDEIEELAAHDAGKERIRGMVGSLSAEAEKVLRTTRRLSSTLRRLLDTRGSTSRLRLATVLREIQAAAVRRAETLPASGLPAVGSAVGSAVAGVEIFTELDLYNVFQRTFWQSPVEFDEVKISNDEPDEDDRLVAFRHLAEMQRLDWETMKSNIESLVQTQSRLTLPELLETYPPTSGSLEVLAYIQLAHDQGHEVDDSQVEVTYIDDETGRRRPYEIPRVVFLAERMRSVAMTPAVMTPAEINGEGEGLSL